MHPPDNPTRGLHDCPAPNPTASTTTTALTVDAKYPRIPPSSVTAIYTFRATISEVTPTATTAHTPRTEQLSRRSTNHQPHRYRPRLHRCGLGPKLSQLRSHIHLAHRPSLSVANPSRGDRGISVRRHPMHSPHPYSPFTLSYSAACVSTTAEYIALQHIMHISQLSNPQSHPLPIDQHSHH
ncbi:hypothetical protein SprV_0802505500 [Sparganum proliferum]